MRGRRLTLIGLLTFLCVAGAVGQVEQAQQTQPEAFSFAVFGDCQPGSREYSPVLEAIADEVGRLDAPAAPAFVVGVGDYINGSSNQTTVRRQWEGFFAGLAPLQARRTIPVGLAPGNHDIMSMRSNAEIFVEYFERLYHSFDYRGCHFIILNSEALGSEGRIAGAQLRWLQQDLAENSDARFTFVAQHRPLFPVDGHVGSSMDMHPEDRDALHRLFVEGGVDCVFHGHEHLYNHQRRDGIHYLITGGAGGPLYASADRGGFHHYLLVTVAADEFTIDVRRINP